MAIVKIGVMQPSTPGEFDWSNLMKHVNAFNRQVSGLQYPVNGTVIKESSYIQHGGVLYQVQGSDYTILGSLTAAIFNYVKITVSGENLIATWITDISAYSWSNEYNYLVASDESSLLASAERDNIIYGMQQKSIIKKATIGRIIINSINIVPAGFLECNGTAVSRTLYSDLFAVIGEVYGAGDGSTTFNLPDLRGVMVRGFDNGRGLDTGRTFGSYQEDELKSHKHLTPGYLLHDLPSVVIADTFYSPNLAGGLVQDTSSTGGSETRSKNVAMMYCIEY